MLPAPRLRPEEKNKKEKEEKSLPIQARTALNMFFLIKLLHPA